MAINTLVGFMYRQLAMGGVAPEAVRFFIVCAPVVVIGECAGVYDLRRILILRKRLGLWAPTGVAPNTICKYIGNRFDVGPIFLTPIMGALQKCVA